MFSAAPTLSKPCAMASSGNISFTDTFTAKRSRTVFSYSTRLSRRNTTRPSARCFAPASSSRAVNCRTNACTCAGCGRGSFFGGISPACTRATTSRHRSNVLGLEKSVSNWSSRKSPLAFSGPWQRRQCSFMKAAAWLSCGAAAPNERLAHKSPASITGAVASRTFISIL